MRRYDQIRGQPFPQHRLFANASKRIEAVGAGKRLTLPAAA
jgi:hypothetical protein